MKGVFNSYFICPKDRLNYYLNQISKIKESRKKLFSQNNKKVTLKTEQKKSNYNEKFETNPPPFDKTKLKSLNINNINNNLNSFNHKSDSGFQRKLRFQKNKYINYNLSKNFNSEKQLYIKDTKILKQFKKYKDLYKQNEDNFDVVKNAFIDDYRKNIRDLNNYLTVNDNRRESDSIEKNNKNIILNDYQHKVKYSSRNKKFINKHIQLYSTNKENTYFSRKSNNNKINDTTSSNRTSKSFKGFFKANSLNKIEKKIINDCYPDNLNILKPRKLAYYNFLSTAGKIKDRPKINQDNYIIINDILGCEEVKIFGVFDGHGEYGHLLTQEIRDMFQEFFLNINLKHCYNEIKGINIYKYFSNNNYGKIYEIFQKIDETIHQKYSGGDRCFRCGTTTNILILFSKKKSINKIISINLGDTKSILINNKKQIKQLNICHVPIVPEERIRIEKNGGEVGRAEWLNGGPLRIWYKGKKDSGLSITRSFGDFEIEKLGVNSIPDIKEYDIDEEGIKIIIIATEGLWTFLKNEKIMDIVLPYYNNKDIKGAIKKLTEISTNLWEIKNPYEISDITIIALFFK